MVLALFSSFCHVIYAAEPTVISNYTELREHLTQGHEVSAIIDLYNCRPGNRSESSWAAQKKLKGQLISNFNFKRFTIYPPEGIRANAILAYDDYVENTPREGMVGVDLQLEVGMNNDVKVIGQSFNPVTYEVTHGKSVYICHMGQPNDRQGIVLYDHSDR